MMLPKHAAENDLPPRPKARVLILSDYYLPGELAGGPIRSLANLVEVLGDEFDFRIVTRNHDLGATTPYANIKSSVWAESGKAQVWYVPRGLSGAIAMIRMI